MRSGQHTKWFGLGANPTKTALSNFILILAVLLVCSFPSISASDDKFGAIAYSPSDRAWGYSYDHNSQAEAELGALQECASRGRGCKILTWFRNNCGALAAGSNGAYGYAWDDSKEDAIARAIDYCRDHGGTNCQWRCWSCNSR